MLLQDPGLDTTTCTQASIQKQKLKYNYNYVDLQTHKMLLRVHVHTYNLTIYPNANIDTEIYNIEYKMLVNPWNGWLGLGLDLAGEIVFLLLKSAPCEQQR